MQDLPKIVSPLSFLFGVHFTDFFCWKFRVYLFVSGRSLHIAVSSIITRTRVLWLNYFVSLDFLIEARTSYVSFTGSLHRG